MTRAREQLVDLLLADDSAARACVHQVTSTAGWSDVFEVADAWSVIPNLRARLLSFGSAVPHQARHDLFVRFQRSFATATLQAHRGVRMCRYLEDRGIPAVVFKGLASIAHLYDGAAAARMIKDVDVLIRPSDLEAALEALQSAGLRLEDGGSLRDYLVFVRNAPGFGGNEAITVRGSDQLALDVHWSFGPHTHPDFHADAIVARAETLTLFDTPVRVAAPADGLLLSAHHSIRETFAADEMMRDVLDTARCLDLLDRRGGLSDALRHASTCRLEVPVLALAAILVRRSGRPPIAPSNVHANRLAELFDLQIREGPIAKDLTYLADTHALRQILMGLSGGWKRYRAQMAAYETQLSGRPVRLRTRLALWFQHIGRIDRSRWRLLRTLVDTKSAYQRHR